MAGFEHFYGSVASIRHVHLNPGHAVPVKETTLAAAVGFNIAVALSGPRIVPSDIEQHVRLAAGDDSFWNDLAQGSKQRIDNSHRGYNVGVAQRSRVVDLDE